MEHTTIEKRMYPPNLIRLCIDRYEGDLAGRIYSKLIAEPLVFRNCCEMLLRADDMFDRCGFPQTFLDKKDFRHRSEYGHYIPPHIQMEDEEMLEQRGELHTLDVFIRSRRQAGWQGVIRAGDNSPPEAFHSERELLQCIWKLIQVNNQFQHKEDSLVKEDMV